MPGFLDTLNHAFCCFCKAFYEAFIRYGRDFEILPLFINERDILPFGNVFAFLYFIVNFNLLVYTKSGDDFLDHFCIFFELWVGLFLRISHGDNGIEYFGVKENGMEMFVVPSFLPEAHDLKELLISVKLDGRVKLDFFSDFFLKSIYRLEGLTLFDLLAISDV